MTQGRRSRYETPHGFGSYVCPLCVDTCEDSQARHGPLASQTHMLVTASYFLASAIIVIVAYFCLNRAWYIPHCCLCWPVGNIPTGQVIWVHSVCGRCVVILKAENTSGYCPGTASEDLIK